MVALIPVLLALSTEDTGAGAPVLVGQPCLPIGVGLLLLALNHEALVLLAVGNMHKAALPVSGLTPQKVLYIAHVASILRGSPFSRLRALIPTAMVPSVASVRAVGVEVLVQGSCLALRRSPTLIPAVSWDLGDQQKSGSSLS